MRRYPIVLGSFFFLLLVAAFLLLNRLESSLYGLKFRIGAKNGTVEEGTSRKIDLEVVRKTHPELHNNFEIHWTGFLYAPGTRLYPLQAGADDRLEIKIDGNLATTRDASLGHQNIQLFIPLQHGFHRIDTDYWQFKGDYSLMLMLNHSNRFLEWLDPPLYFPQIPSRGQLMFARAVSFLRNLFAWWIILTLLTIIAIVSYYSSRSIQSSAQRKIWRVIKVSVPALIVLYAALLRFEALTIKHGVVTTPALVRNLQEHVGILRHLHPDTVRWQPGSNPYEKGDPVNYLRMARSMKGFYAAQFREPFYVFWVKQSLRLFNQQDIAVSFASMLFSVLAVLATFILAQYAFSYWVGVIASLCVAVDQELISIGVDGWRDDTFMFLVLMFSYALLRLFRKASFGNALFAGIIAGLVCLTRMTSLSFIVPGYLFVLFAGKDPSWKVRFKSLILSTSMFAVLIAPFLINCAIVYGDPLFSVNDNTKFYRARENLAAKEPQSVAAYLKGRLIERPYRFIDIGLEGLTRYPFLNKWKGFNYLSPFLSKFLAASALLGIILLLFSSHGRLILLVLMSSLIPYAFTYEIAGGYEWRFTMHAYPFYLIAGALFITVAIGAFLTRNTWPLFSDQPLTKRSILTVSLILLFILAGGWLLL
ncbi:MAG TPA: glycosyltransferase family 39 protein, partial [Acidobacteriota bacterium]|nr:glycosyltransferase family 39 protein [Acidobacteriota bacterium]